MLDLRLISADALKLRRRRGMMAISLFLLAGTVVIGLAIAAIQHGADPAKVGPPGGLENYLNAISSTVMMALVVGAIIGATAGTQDLESGVFRDLAATGRSRTALFTSRIAGAWAVAITIAVLGAGIAAMGSVALAGAETTPGVGAVIGGTLAVAAAAALSSATAAGASTLVGSRGPAIGVMVAFFLAIEPNLANASFLGDARRLFPSAALHRIGDLPDPAVRVALGTAVAAVIAWIAVAFAAGAWRTRTREI